MKSKRSTVALAIRKQILSGQWRAGSRLPERLLCEFTGASRQSVREALQTLLRDGYVTNEPNCGFRVATLDAAEAADIYQVRAVLEGLAAQNFIKLATRSERTLLEAALGSLEAAVNREDVDAQLQAVEQFYDALLAACYNRVLKSTLESLHGKISRLRATSILGPGRIGQAIGEMRRIVDAIKDSNEQEAFQACVDHMNNTSAVAIRVIGSLNQAGKD
ncbi:GntR family transcriptional regulator [Allopusillimonas soli]|uniref:GntR family transcriptional regulator n=1 Tax=Allopusillimonas soli TaxID=659016 RepID=A0A853FCX0_9BURK|nr:GntR family transcriptional regulator [Allopusillimonas soli]NYT36391.1 GntR family transcriptional regulator [Allopusillimonas soli]TEA74904.1 GntR family transcriptional regulator [Allopusillimonas soli]